MSNFADYRTALTTSGARRPVLTSLLARMPVAMVGFSLLLYTQRETGSFAIAGLVSACALIGTAIGAVAQGRIMDRLGPTRPLLVTVAVLVISVTAAVIAIETGRPTPVLAAIGFTVGLSEPMVVSASRALWPRLIPPGPIRDAALAYEAISMEIFFILGPAISGLLVAMPWAGTGFVAGAAAMAVGGVGFALTPVVRTIRPKPEARELLGALASPGMRTLALAALGFGVTVGFVEVAVPAAATEAGRPALGGILLAIFSLTSVAFGLWYALHPWPKAVHLRLPVLLGLFALLIAPMAIPSSLLGLTITLLVAGMWITPQSTTHSMTIELVAPRGTATEAFGWVVTAVTLGLAGGQSVSGYLVEHVGIWASFLTSSAIGLVFAFLVWLRRHTVSPGRSGSSARPSRPAGEPQRVPTSSTATAS